MCPSFPHIDLILFVFLLALLVLTLYQECVLLLTLSNAIVSLAQVHSIIRFVERLKTQESAINFGHCGDFPIFFLPNV